MESLNSSSLKPLEQFLLDFTWDLLEKILKICSNGSAPLNKIAAMYIYGTYMVKTLKNLLPQTRKALRLNKMATITIYGKNSSPESRNL